MLEERLHGVGEHALAGEHVAGNRKTVGREMTAPADALRARIGSGAATGVDQVHLPMFAPLVVRDERIDDLLRRIAARKTIEPGGPVAGIDERLRRERTDVASRVRAKRADREEAACNGDAECAAAITGDDGPGHAILLPTRAL